MNINPKAKRVLIYGDSFTYGRMMWQGRYASNKRFTGVMQKLLWSDYELIEEWLRWRTVAWENPFFPHRDWLSQFAGIVGSHLPLDVLILFLWTNDCNAWFEKRHEDFEKSYDEYAQIITYRVNFLGINTPKVILVSPPVVQENNLPTSFASVFRWVAQKSAQLHTWYAAIASHHGRGFFDAGTVVSASPIDGIHIDEEGHETLAKHLMTYMLSYL